MLSLIIVVSSVLIYQKEKENQSLAQPQTVYSGFIQSEWPDALIVIGEPPNSFHSRIFNLTISHQFTKLGEPAVKGNLTLKLHNSNETLYSLNFTLRSVSQYMETIRNEFQIELNPGEYDLHVQFSSPNNIGVTIESIGIYDSIGWWIERF